MLTKFYPSLAPIQGPSCQCKDTLTSSYMFMFFFKKKFSSWFFKKENKEASLIWLSSQVPSLMKLLV